MLPHPELCPGGLAFAQYAEAVADGLSALKRAGALTFAQDEASSAVFGMPRAAIEALERAVAVSRATGAEPPSPKRVGASEAAAAAASASGRVFTMTGTIFDSRAARRPVPGGELVLEDVIVDEEESLLPKAKKSERHDVVVIGSGMAGMTAALQARLDGLPADESQGGDKEAHVDGLIARAKALLGEAERRAQASPAGAHHDDVVGVIDEGILTHDNATLTMAKTQATATTPCANCTAT